VNGQKIIHLMQDNGGSAQKSAQISLDFINRQKVDALFGYFGEGSLENLSQMSAFRQSGIPMVAPLSGMRINGAGSQIFYIRPEYAVEAKKGVAHFLNHGVKRFAVVYADDAYGRAALQAVEAELKKHKLNVEGQFPVGSSDESLNKAISQCSSKKPQATIMALQTLPAAKFVKAYRKVDQGGFLMGLSLINNETLYELAGKEASTGVMLSEVVPHPNDYMAPISVEHQRVFKIFRDEPPSHLTLEGFIAAKYLVNAIKQAGSNFTQAQLVSRLASSSDLDLGGFFLAFAGDNRRGSNMVDVNVINKQGRLIN
jgi:branched-chain amino acid transport system substrate-binding protein